ATSATDYLLPPFPTRRSSDLDWNINDYHRASLTYQRTEEVKPNPYNQSGNRVVLSSHWYNYDSLTENTSLQLFSDWSENFSTERSEEHTSELQSRENLVCRLL